MLFVKLHINGEKIRVRHTTDVLARNIRTVRDVFSELFHTPSQAIVIVPQVVTGKDMSLSKNMPDVLVEITHSGDSTPPNAKVACESLIESCIDFETLHFHVLITNLHNSFGSYYHRPKE